MGGPQPAANQYKESLMSKKKGKSEQAPPKAFSGDPSSYKPEVAPVAEAAPAAAAQASATASETPATPPAAVQAEAKAEPPPNPVAEATKLDIGEIIRRHRENLEREVPKAANVNVGRSTVIRPVKLVHVIASKMYEENPNVTRKAVIAECEKAGIATHTARTQYQIWSSARKSDAERTAAVNAAFGAVSHKIVTVVPNGRPATSPAPSAPATTRKVKFPRG